MLKKLIPVSVAFMAACLACFMVKETMGSVIMFGISAAAFGFLCWLERKNLFEIDQLKNDVQDAVQKVNSITVALNWNK